MPDDRAVPTSPKPRVIRVFVSSTFRDMHDERDELVLHVFPQLRKLCEARGVAFADVDLRWGIPDERKAEGEVLPICLEEIQRCRPFFIGLLGERYGSLPDEVPDDLVAQQPWLAEHRTKSVTELEILHGVLNNPAMTNRACFYFRDPAYVERVPAAQRADFVEDDPAKRSKLAALKQRVRDSGLAIEDYRDPQHLGELVLHDLTVAVNQDFPETEPPSQLDRDAADHEAFAQSRTGVYIGRQEYFARLDAHAVGDGPPLVILGESGSGKSALLANWALRHREAHPDDLVLMHFIGSSPYSSDWAAMLRRILGEFNRRLDLKIEIPDKPDALRLTFANALHMAAARLSGGTGVSPVSPRRIILILDALNQLEDRDGAPDLVWLPPVVPAGVRLILSTLPGRPLDDLRKRSWPSLAIEPLNPSERSELIARYLAQYTKALSPSLADQIAAAEQAANPLYLRALLEELRVFGSHEQLFDRIHHYLAAHTIPELYEKILARYEQDYERDRRGLVRDAMTALWAARRGLSEAELLDILGTDGQPLPRAHWSHFAVPVDQCFITRSGLLTFAHDYLREATCHHWLPTEHAQRTEHLRLARFFQPADRRLRRIDELPWQLAQAAQWEQLYRLLADLVFLRAAWIADDFDVRGHWANLEANSSLRLVPAYRHVVQNPGLHSEIDLWIVAEVLRCAGHLEEASSLVERLTQSYGAAQEWPRVAFAIGELGLICYHRGDFPRARALFELQGKIGRELGDDSLLASGLHALSNVIAAVGDLDEAMKLLKEARGVFQRLGSTDGLAACLHSEGNILYSRGDIDESLRLLGQSELLFRESGDIERRAKSLHTQALILQRQGQSHRSMELEREGEQLYRQLGDRYGLSVSLGAQAAIHCTLGELDKALVLYKQQEAICRELPSLEGLHASLHGQGNVHYLRGELEDAMRLYRESEALCRQIGQKTGVINSILGQANVHCRRGNSADALALQERAEHLGREVGSQRAIASSLETRARIHEAAGDLAAAMVARKELERTCRSMSDLVGLRACLIREAIILAAWDNVDGATQVLDELDALCPVPGNGQEIQYLLSEQAQNQLDRGDLEGAMRLFKYQEQTCRQHGHLRGLIASLGNQAILLAEVMNRHQDAIPLAEEANRLASEHRMDDLVQQVKPILDRLAGGVP